MTVQPQFIEIEPRPTAVVRGVVPMPEIRSFFDRSFTQLFGVIERQGAIVASPAHALYHGEPSTEADLEVGVTTEPLLEADGGVEVSELSGGRVARLIHEGSYDDLGASWEQLRRWITEAGHTPGEVVWEVYLTEPTPNADPVDMSTELNWIIEAAPSEPV